MDCVQDQWLSNPEYLRQFNLKAARMRVPLSGSIELTRRCNLRCVHCYLGRSDRHTGAELDTSQVKHILDQVVEAGCLNLLFTGGEPLLRPDFPELYCYARRLGLIVSVFSNGTRITDPVVAAFRAHPPYQVEITVYGASQETYERISGVPGSYHSCLDGIRRLKAEGIRVGLKTMLMNLNQNDLANLRALAAGLGMRFRFDPCLFPGLDGDPAPLRYRLPAEAVVERELDGDDQASAWAEQYIKIRGVAAGDRLFQCGAGVTGFHVTAIGHLQPCVLVPDPSFDLRAGSFREGWTVVIPRLHDQNVPAEYPCTQCEKRFLCPACPALNRLEGGASGGTSTYLCAVGHQRFQRIEAFLARRTA